MTEKLRNWKYDAMRIVMSILVVLIHASAGDCYQSYAEKAPIIYNSLGRIAVPIFYMIAGALSLTRTESIGKAYRRLLRRIVLPLVLATVFFAYYRCATAGGHFWSILLGSATAPVYYHLGFMYQMISLYLLMPLIQAFWGHLTLGKRSLLCLGLLVLSRLCPAIPTLSQSCIYAAIGACCVECVEKWKAKPFFTNQKQMLVSAGLFLCYLMASAVMAGLTLHFSALSGYLNEQFFEYHSLAAICFMASVLFMPLKKPSPKCMRLLVQWNALTLGIYLIHPAILTILQGQAIPLLGINLQLHWEQWLPRLAIPTLTLLCYGISALIVLCYFITKVLFTKAKAWASLWSPSSWKLRRGAALRGIVHLRNWHAELLCTPAGGAGDCGNGIPRHCSSPAGGAGDCGNGFPRRWRGDCPPHGHILFWRKR
ncbi:MAG: acyltransferase family protein, partial [Clostridia bacterium]